MTLLSDVLPEYHFAERHSLAVDAPRERIWAVARETTLGELPVVRALFRLRGLPAAAERPLLDLPGFGVLAEEPGRELVIGAVGRPWSVRGGIVTDADFAAFAAPGYAKMAMDLRVEHGRVSSETRVFLTDAESRSKFARYWVVIRPFSALIRRLWLRAVARRAIRP